MKLLVIDVGNTHTVLGVYDGTRCCSTGASRPRRGARRTSTACWCAAC